MPTHGSMTKAGKVRKQTPKIEGKPRKGLPPRIRNRQRFVNRFLKRREEAVAAGRRRR
ncbi:MAG: 30S ribosomal protein S30e [Desulfurococcales archaeon]|nr:30S ribosomal protein S30e [Desulfurococcales archaeon]